ncbi:MULTISPECIES: GreA/GreB family elongation factor [unclassified Paenibacillus]|uniref:GreA/GreB family elongation factor n=1 Tax=unclassified Paenibacillus TaxID=185978 RepID=UPI001C11444A|nr:MULTISPECIES: GreA/GreB family elongation factor [unclassified Paenibacillus]MBU5442805.1 GreA/GreB family elongation factor [Paenibacillus sp. MSJ-34]CAH0117878.1 Transcription elongation factor GreA [Paenibacillus sp. CECT 9249]
MKDNDIVRYLKEQLSYFKERKLEFIDTHYPQPEHPARAKTDSLLSRYTSRVQQLIEETGESGLRSTDIVVIGSTVTICDLDTGGTDTLTICFPDQANIDGGGISFLSPMGSQLLLAGKDETVTIEVPNGKLPIRIEQIEFEART